MNPDKNQFSTSEMHFKSKINSEKVLNARLGLQTIIYGETFPLGLELTLEKIKKMGFAGVEFFQTPSKLGNPQVFEALMAKYGLVLLGLTGGSLADRREFCAQLFCKPKFIYIQDLEPGTLHDALACGCHVAVHPIQNSKLDRYSTAVEKLKGCQYGLSPDRISILPDSAHLYLGNESLAEILKSAGHYIHYVHVKDWSPEFGTSMFCYARGFCELGQGIVMHEHLREILHKWHVSNDENWIIVEQDSTCRSPSASCEMSLDWLRGKKTNRWQVRMPAPDGFNYGSLGAVKVISESSTGSYLAKLLETLTRANLDSSRDVDQHYRTVLQGFSSIVDLKCANIWEISPREKTAILRSHWQPSSAAKHTPDVVKLELEKALCGLAVNKQEPVSFEDVSSSRNDGRYFADSRFIQGVKLRSMVSIPLPNRWNPHQPEIIINLFPETLAEIVRNNQFTPRFQAALEILKPFLAITIECAWEQKRAQIHHELDWIAAMTDTAKSLLNGAVEPIKEYLRCDDVKLFLIDQSGTKLQQVAPPPINRDQLGDEQNVAKQVWTDRAGYNSGTRVSQQRDPDGSHLLTPLYHQGRPLREVMGVIWCQRKRQTNTVRDFTVTDELTLDAAQEALVPQLERMIGAERRAKTMARVSHELKEPLTLFRGAISASISEMAKYGWNFQKDHLGKMRDYLNLMVQVVAKASFLKHELKDRLQPTRTLLFEDVIQPAIEDLIVHLNRAAYSTKAIVVVPNESQIKNYGEGQTMQMVDIRQLPPLYVDKSRFRQVVFNMLSNAIKYSKPSEYSFKVEILARPCSGGTELIFRDWGSGVNEEMKESIFEEGVRGPQWINSDVLGDGLGLFIVREILAAHQATIKVTRCCNPTEFTITLPNRLSDFNQIILFGTPATKQT